MSVAEWLFPVSLGCTAAMYLISVAYLDRQSAAIAAGATAIACALRLHGVAL